jgi:hypothetical protein
MPAQYTIEMDLNAYKGKRLNVELFKSTMHNISNQLKEDGWCAQKIETEDKVSLKFWADNQFVEKMLEKHIAKFNTGFNGIMLYFTEKVFGNKTKELAINNAKVAIKEKIENALEDSIENELSSLKNVLGFSLIKGSEPLFINETKAERQVDKPRVKP